MANAAPYRLRHRGLDRSAAGRECRRSPTLARQHHCQPRLLWIAVCERKASRQRCARGYGVVAQNGAQHFGHESVSMRLSDTGEAERAAIIWGRSSVVTDQRNQPAVLTRGVPRTLSLASEAEPDDGHIVQARLRDRASLPPAGIHPPLTGA